MTDGIGVKEKTTGNQAFENMRKGLLGPESKIDDDLKEQLSTTIDEALERGTDPLLIVQETLNVLRESAN